MSTDPKRVDALQLIFSVFLGLLLVVFIGVGMWTFYPGPMDQDSPQEQELQKLYREQERLYGKQGGLQQPVDEAEIERIQTRIDELQKERQALQDDWARNTSIIILVFATLLMAISLFLPDHMRVFSNGILLGGLFSVIYGTGWSFAGGDSRARFFVVAAALALALGIGYMRFIRSKRGSAEQPVAQPVVAGDGVVVDTASGAAVAELSARVEALEARIAAAAAELYWHGREREDEE